jgi:hypothetical protein
VSRSPYIYVTSHLSHSLRECDTEFKHLDGRFKSIALAGALFKALNLLIIAGSVALQTNLPIVSLSALRTYAHVLRYTKYVYEFLGGAVKLGHPAIRFQGSPLARRRGKALSSSHIDRVSSVAMLSSNVSEPCPFIFFPHFIVLVRPLLFHRQCHARKGGVQAIVTEAEAGHAHALGTLQARICRGHNVL